MKTFKMKKGFTMAEGATHVAMQHNNRKLAFTLTEVLITLAVIGIVAVMTIPNLVQNYQSKAWETAATTFNRKLGEALKVMNTQETLAGYSSTEDFVKELSKHLKITKTCDKKNLTACFNNKVMWGEDEVDISELSTSADMGHDDWKTNMVGFQMANGVTGLVAYNPACTQDPYNNRHIAISGGIDGRKGKVEFPGTDCIAMVYDVTGYGKPNTKEKDISGNVTTLAKAKSCDVKFADHCWAILDQSTPLSSTECNEHKAELGIPDCCTEEWCSSRDDYWAGAVKQCGGIKNMPTMEQLAQLATQIYGVSIGAKDNKYPVTVQDQVLFDTLLSKSPYSDCFFVWSSEEYRDLEVYNRVFYKTYTRYNDSNTSRESGGEGGRNITVCLSD